MDQLAEQKPPKPTKIAMCDENGVSHDVTFVRVWHSDKDGRNAVLGDTYQCIYCGLEIHWRAKTKLREHEAVCGEEQFQERRMQV